MVQYFRNSSMNASYDCFLITKQFFVAFKRIHNNFCNIIINCHCFVTIQIINMKFKCCNNKVLMFA